jgi:hypothetical protein
MTSVARVVAPVVPVPVVMATVATVVLVPTVPVPVAMVPAVPVPTVRVVLAVTTVATTSNPHNSSPKLGEVPARAEEYDISTMSAEVYMAPALCFRSVRFVRAHVWRERFFNRPYGRKIKQNY